MSAGFSPSQLFQAHPGCRGRCWPREGLSPVTDVAVGAAIPVGSREAPRGFFREFWDGLGREGPARSRAQLLFPHSPTLRIPESKWGSSSGPPPSGGRNIPDFRPKPLLARLQPFLQALSLLAGSRDRSHPS